MVTTRKARRQARLGASAVEFALVAPLFLLLLCGICVYAVWFLLAISVQSLATESARASLAGLDDAERRGLAAAYVAAHAPDAGLSPNRLAQTVDITDGRTRVVVRLDVADHPIMALRGLIPSPPSVIERGAVVAGGGGAS